MPTTTNDHAKLIRRGLKFHENRKYERALPFFEQAFAMAPTCPNAKYNLANTLHMLGRGEKACELFRELEKATDRELLEGCDDLAGTPRSLRLDVYFMLFVATLHAHGKWRESAPYLRKHLRSRARGVRSLWSKAGAMREAVRLQNMYSPRSRSVTEWEQ